MLRDKTILITGGTGSFGKSFTKTILSFYPEVKKIIIFSRDEFKQFHMANMPEFKDNPKLRFFIGDVRDKERLYRAFTDVNIVIHAAALKQVPSCEYNPFEAVKTNIIGTQNVINTAIDKNVEKAVALSTDKACAPINLYGATKLCADKLFIAGNAYVGSSRTKLAVVRYGNVAGSRGSVIPYFQKLIQTNTKKLPITDFNMTRFWLKLDDAVKMVLIALEKMTGGELFVKKIPSMKITDLAKALSPEADLKEVGIRPGEKIHEMMISREDARYTVDCKDYFVIQPSLDARNAAIQKQKASPVPENFEYHSGKNTEWLTIPKMKAMIDEV